MIHIKIPGKPVPMARPRVYHNHAVNPRRMRNYERYAQIEGMAQYKGEPIKDNPVSLVIRVFRPIPESWSKKKRHKYNGRLCIKRPDCDNYVKLVTDAFIGVLYEDDNLVAHVDAWKCYSLKPRVEFNCRTLK